MLNKSIEQVKQQLRKDISKPLACGDITICSIEDIEIILQYAENLENVLELGLNKDKQHCFNEDGNTGKCLGYGAFNDDEPCEYCKTCERLSIKETD